MAVEPEVTRSVTVRYVSGCGSLYCTLRFNDEGKLIGILGRLGKSGGCQALNTEVVCGLITECLRAGADIHKVLGCLKGTDCHMATPAAGVFSCADAFAKAIEYGLEAEKSGKMRGDPRVG